MIKSCLMKTVGDFFYDVKFNDEIVGRARVLSDWDKTIIQRKSTVHKESGGTLLYEEITVESYEDEKGYHPETKRRIPMTELDTGAMMDWYILLSFGGKDGLSTFKLDKNSEEGWAFEDACSLENIRLMIPQVKAEIFTFMMEKNKAWEEESKGILKN